MSISVAGIPSSQVQSPGGSQPGISMQRANDAAGGLGSEMQITFAPPQAGSGGPMDRIGSGLVDRLKAFEQTRTEHRSAMSGMNGGPANPIEAAKAELLSGPANIRPASGSEIATSKSGDSVDQAINAMTRSFDYAIETQLIVKTGSQLSTTASSLMRGQ